MNDPRRPMPSSLPSQAASRSPSPGDAEHADARVDDPAADHGHDHGSRKGHGHGTGMHVHGSADQRRIGWAFLIIAVFMAVEVVGGVLSGSLALLADAGHMISDSVALGLSWLAIRLSRRPPTPALSFGYQRFEILAAFVNGCALFVIAAWIVFEAVRRFFEPVPVAGTAMLVVASAGLLANIVAFLVLNGGNRGNLNMRSAWLHVLGDLLGSAVAIVAALVILFTGWTAADPILSIFVAVIVLKSAWSIVRESAHILLEGSPAGFDAQTLKEDIEHALPAAADVHHIHAWSISGERSMVTLHVRRAPDAEAGALLAAVRQRLIERHGFDHVTIQVEDAATDIGCGDATASPIAQHSSTAVATAVARKSEGDSSAS